MDGRGLPTPGDLQERILRGDRPVTPRGYFPHGAIAPSRRRGGPIDPSIPILVDALERMLRNLVNLNVRQPSHMAPPFRAIPWTYQSVSDGTGLLVEAVVDINGNAEVPPGFLGVMTWARFDMAPLGATLAYAWGELGGDPATLAIRRNGLALPGMLGLLPTYRLLPADSMLATIEGGPSQLNLPPVPLQEGDQLSWELNLGSGSGVGQGDCAFYVQLGGYLYPREVDADGVAGTLADRATLDRGESFAY